MYCRAALAAAILLLPAPGFSYSVLTHEAIIDTCWDAHLKPLIVQRFPQIAPDDLVKAHAYAYGGAIVQDMGYYPFGSRFFSDLVHYVRTGGFVLALLRESSDPNEYAFALGALAHYTADNIGHPQAVNVIEPVLYPKIGRKFGRRVTYEDAPADHLKTEFGFDVLEVARGNFAPQAYHDFIGFEVSKPVLERAFFDTYSLHLKDVFGNLDLALGTYRYTVGGLIPKMTKVAWSQKKDTIEKLHPGTTRDRYLYRLKVSMYRKNWGETYHKPGITSRILAFVFNLIPKVGPFKAFAIHVPGDADEKVFLKSFDNTIAAYQGRLRPGSIVTLALADTNLDTGADAKHGEYRMADDAWAKLEQKLASAHADPSPALAAARERFNR